MRGETIDDVALGFGDVNLSGVLGLILGFPGILLGLFIAIMVAGLVSLVFLVAMLLVRKYRLFMALPYGPFLVIGAVTLLYFRDLLAQLFN
jgi:prepilin signal peptidase PulO-like enzyme (type II secretory pathway)